jgi:hypothetical protein
MKKDKKLYKRQTFLGLFLTAKMLLLMVGLLTLISFSKHPFYMSVVEIEHNAAEKELQIACKIFTDDFEEALKSATGQKIDLQMPGQNLKNEAHIVRYLKQHLQLEVNGKPVLLELVGTEQMEEATWTYLVVKNTPSVSSLKVTTDLLYENRKEQVNILHCIVQKKRQSFRLTYPETSHVFEW